MLMRRLVVAAGRLQQDRSGILTVITALFMTTMILLITATIDLSRLNSTKMMLQHAADGAALAGASVFSGRDAAEKAVAVARRTFDLTIFPAGITVTSLDATARIQPQGYRLEIHATAETRLSCFGALLKHAALTASASALTPID